MSDPQAFPNTPNYIDALLDQDVNGFWNYGNGYGVSLTFNFPVKYNPVSDLPSYLFNAQEMAYVRQALTLWSNVANITFTEASDQGTADIEIRKAELGPGVGGTTYFPHAVNNGINVGGSVYLDVDAYGNLPPLSPGTHGFETILHELGHALGLKHPGNYNAGGGGAEPPYLPSGQDYTDFTIMSYNDYWGGLVYPATPMLYDIAAIQWIYGTRESHVGDDVYTFTSGTVLAPPLSAPMTIWDTGGNDTIEASTASGACTINLNPGAFSSIPVGAPGTGVNNVAIAFNCWIENASGSNYSDIIVGNELDNVLRGYGGNDTIDGGGGYDTAIFSGLRSSYTITPLNSTSLRVVGSDGNDTLSNVEKLIFNDSVYFWHPDGNPDFDQTFYLSQNPDVRQAGVDPFPHYNQYGWHEGRDPNSLFSTNLYLATNPDVKAASVNPLDHYHESGWKEGRDPGPNFDTTLYLLYNPDVKAAGIDPLQHYLDFGAAEGRQRFVATGTAVNGFDAEYYLMHNPDVAAAGIDPLQHYNIFGWQEGRNPNAYFDDAGYLANNPDVKNANINPLAHYESYGWQEGRNPSAWFDTKHYLQANQDVAAAHVNPLDHFLNSGIYEGRSSFFAGSWHFV
ncbi:MAG: M10 family metallopeptidase [Rhizobiales bacterium]|nr:M10 family metallopeptidase [Hyphomicrobiales bacterium]